MIEIYTDGSALANGSKNNEGGFGVVVYQDGQLVDCYAHREKNTTNNIMEMKAILFAAIVYGKYNPIIYSDSSYAINAFTVWRHTWKRNGWFKSNGEEVKNLELIKLYDELEQANHFNLVKVKGHSDVEGNIMADKLATAQLTRAKVMERKI